MSNNLISDTCMRYVTSHDTKRVTANTLASDMKILTVVSSVEVVVVSVAVEVV